MSKPHLAFLEFEPGTPEPTVKSGILDAKLHEVQGIRIVTPDRLQRRNPGLAAMKRLRDASHRLLLNSKLRRDDVLNLLSRSPAKHKSVLLIYDPEQDAYQPAAAHSVREFFDRQTLEESGYESLVLVEVGEDRPTIHELLGELAVLVDTPSTATTGEAEPIEAIARSRVSAAQWREQLSRDWWTSEQVARAVGTKTATNANQYASQLRRQGRLLGARSISANAFKHPPFQFTPEGLIRPGIRELLKSMTPSEKDPDGWNRVLWLYAPHPRLGGRRPAEVYAEQPQAVLALAKDAFENADEAW